MASRHKLLCDRLCLLPVSMKQYLKLPIFDCINSWLLVRNRIRLISVLANPLAKMYGTEVDINSRKRCTDECLFRRASRSKEKVNSGFIK